MNTDNTNQEVTTQEAIPQETTGGPASYAVGESILVAIRDITVPEDARPHPPEDIASRAASIEREGQLQNALLSKEDSKLVLVYGHGRLLSTLKLGRDKLRCDIREGLTLEQKVKLALDENAERENESPFHTAMMYQKLMTAKGWTQEELAKELGKGLTRVEEFLRLAKVDPEVRKTPAAAGVSIRQCLSIAKLTQSGGSAPGHEGMRGTGPGREGAGEAGEAAAQSSPRQGGRRTEASGAGRSFPIPLERQRTADQGAAAQAAHGVPAAVHE